MPWGWLELFAISLTFLQALLFVPGVSAVRPILRISSYMAGPFVWFMVFRKRSLGPPPPAFASRSWLLFCIGWLVLSVAHPNSYSVLTAVGQVALYIAVLSPAFWADRLADAPARVGRLMALLFLCNALSAGVGVLQVYYPGRFDPPVIPALNNKFGGEDLKYETADGRRILRPCGLTDTPGGAAFAGSTAAIIGLCLALRPIGIIRRSICMGMAFVGLAAVYYSHVRSVFLMVLVCLGVLTLVLTLQRNYRQASLLVTGGAAMVVGSMLWAMRTVGSNILRRFTVLFEDDFITYFNQMRGNYVYEALTKTLWEYPLGYGLGWWGQIQGLFGDPNKLSFVWVEVMVAAWVYDGGLPLLIGYGGAVALALYDSGRVALTSRDPDLAFWAAVVLSLNISIVANCLSYITFLSPLGMMFWLLAAAINGADRWTRKSREARGSAKSNPPALASATPGSRRLMRVGFNARLLHAPETRGWNRYTVNLLAALPALGVELVLYTDRPIHPAQRARLVPGSFVERLGSVRPHERWEQHWLPRQCRRDGVDLLHAPANFGLPWSRPCPRVLTLHDAIDQVYYAPRRPARVQWTPRALRSRLAHWIARSRAERVITDSAHARGDLVDHLGLPAAKVRVVPLAADPVFARAVSAADRASTRARLGLSRPYVFYVGGWEGRKNLPFLARGFASAALEGVELVFAGGRDDQRAELTALAASLGVGDQLRLLGWVDDADLPALYAEALCLAYPSVHEGFGLQAVEAMAAGCPALVARATSLPEVVGDAGATFSLDDPAELAALLRRVATDPAWRHELSRRGRERAARFSWERTATDTLAVYRELV